MVVLSVHFKQGNIHPTLPIHWASMKRHLSLDITVQNSYSCICHFGIHKKLSIHSSQISWAIGLLSSLISFTHATKSIFSHKSRPKVWSLIKPPFASAEADLFDQTQDICWPSSDQIYKHWSNSWSSLQYIIIFRTNMTIFRSQETVRPQSVKSMSLNHIPRPQAPEERLTWYRKSTWFTGYQKRKKI